MERIITGNAMKKIDNYTINEIGIPSLVLMERAAMAMCTFFLENAEKSSRILCVCGMGNNGADGMALARMLTLKGYRADVVTVGDEEKSTTEWKQQTNIAVNCGVNINSWEELKSMKVTTDIDDSYNDVWENILDAYDYVVDALFGIGLTRCVEGEFAKVINGINHVRRNRENRGKRLTVIATDVSSGLDADNGIIMGCAVKADYTITFGAMKSGLLLCMGKDVSGNILVRDIGFPENAYIHGAECSEKYVSFTRKDILEVIKRPAHSNKGTYGKVLVIAGSENMYGAAYLSSMAALKTGCGLVRIITHKNNRELLYKMIPEAIIQVYDKNEELSEEEVSRAVSWSDVTVIGPGIGTKAQAVKLVRRVMTVTKDKEQLLVIDADGLNIISSDESLKKLYHEKIVITPHLGEASRLMGVPVKAIAEDIVNCGRKYAGENGINVVLKDSTSVILGIESLDNKCNNRVCVNTSGNAGMATAGSGDVLAGIIAGVLAGGIGITTLVEDYGKSCAERIFVAVSLAVYIHGMAGDRAAEKYGQTSMTATDILNMICEIVND